MNKVIEEELALGAGDLALMLLLIDVEMLKRGSLTR